MMHTESYKGHTIMIIAGFTAWQCFICYGPYLWAESKSMFQDSDDAIAYGKQQIDILLSKSLNIQP